MSSSAAVSVMANQIDDMTKITVADIKKRFDDMDTNSNGTISYGEMYAALKRRGFTIDDAYVWKVFNEIDSDHNGAIDFSEYMALWGQVYLDSNQTK